VLRRLFLKVLPAISLVAGMCLLDWQVKSMAKRYARHETNERERIDDEIRTFATVVWLVGLGLGFYAATTVKPQ
jgi:hypothetical protein